jgi:hypothetical protein
MAAFQKTVLTVATVILIISLCAIGIILYRQKNNYTYPPVIANCPDYWEISKNVCKNSLNLGNSSCSKTMDFTNGRWGGTNGLKSKYKWAKACKLTWDGITDNADLSGA